jgi:toxin ParE1/3/4
VPRYEHWGIRRCVHGNYLIFYRVRADAVDIVHVLHGAMDYESMLFPDV